MPSKNSNKQRICTSNWLIVKIQSITFSSKKLASKLTINDSPNRSSSQRKNLMFWATDWSKLHAKEQSIHPTNKNITIDSQYKHNRIKLSEKSSMLLHLNYVVLKPLFLYFYRMFGFHVVFQWCDWAIHLQTFLIQTLHTHIFTWNCF